MATDTKWTERWEATRMTATWKCPCGAVNSMLMDTCPSCGKPRP